MDVKRDMLNWAIKRSGKSVGDLEGSRATRMVRKWLAGESRPTLRQLEKFANATYTPLGRLLLSQPPEDTIPIPYFRTRGQSVSEPSINLLDTIQIVEQRQDWMREQMMANGHEPLGFVDSAVPKDSATDVAYMMRDGLGLPEEWPGNLKSWVDVRDSLAEHMEESGVFVTISGIVGSNTRRPLSVDEFRGFVLVDDYASFVFVNGRDSRQAQAFTLVHGLAHVWMGKSAAFDLRMLDPADDAVERACGKAAAEFLAPEEGVRQLWAEFSGKPNRYGLMSGRAKASPLVLARRAVDMDLIDRNEFLMLYEQPSAPGGGKGRGGGFYAAAQNRIGRRFGRAVVTAALEGKMLYREAYNLTGLNRGTFDKYAAHVGAG